MIDVKKLIIGFLILAVAAVGSGLILSLIGGMSTPGQEAAAQGPTIAADTTGSGLLSNLSATTTGGTPSAFVNTGSLQGNAAEMLAQVSGTSTDNPSASSTNLTNILASAMLDGLVTANPSGASIDASGNLAFNAPNTQTVAQDVSSNPALSSLTIPNWDTEAQAQVITIEKNPPANAAQQYEAALTNIYQTYFISTGIQGDLSGTASNAAIASNVASQIQAALAASLAVPTPPAFVNFQRDFIRALIYDKNSARLVAESTNDPVKAALILQGENAKYAAVISELQAQQQKISSQGVSFLNNTPNAKPPLIAEIFGINTAHAQWSVFDWANLSQLIKTYVENVALQILKNSLVSLIQQKVLTWIQGSGAPQFVQDFGQQMVSSYESAAMNTIAQYTQCVPPVEATTLDQLLTTPAAAQNLPGTNASPGQVGNFCSAEFNSAIVDQGVSQFAYGFTNFNNYLQLFEPGGNIWSAAFQTSDAAQQAGGNNQQANQTKNIAQQGWSGSETCSDGSNPNGYGIYCYSKNSGQTLPDPSNAFCGPQDIKEIKPNNGLCADGSTPKITSPGQVTGQSFYAALKSGITNITSANDIAGLLSSLLHSILNTLASDAINYSQQETTNLLNGNGGGTISNPGITGISTSSIQGGGTTSTSTPTTAISCFPATQSITIASSTGMAAATISVSGGAINTTCAVNGNCPAGVQSDGSPTYSWTATGSLESISGAPLTGSSINVTYNTPGTYSVSATASTDGTVATCQINVQ